MPEVRKGSIKMSIANRDFVGKRLDNGEWVDGSVVFLSDGSGKAFIVQKIMYKNKEIFEVDRKTVSQDTGKVDITRTHIFENDIVEEAGGHRSVVKYSEKEAKFVLESKYVVTELGNKQVTVIGNIFDNADLME